LLSKIELSKQVYLLSQCTQYGSNEISWQKVVRRTPEI